MKLLFIIFQYLLPHHLLSRLVGLLAASHTPWIKDTFIQRFIRRYRVNMQEAADPDPRAYACFNDFFTRALVDDARPIEEAHGAIVSPADGAISALGDIAHDTIFQAKGKAFSLTTLLGGSPARAAPFLGGQFATVYLSPRDYHRVHMPFAGTLQEMIYVPGRLYSVNQTTAENIDGLFARNERAVCIFATEAGPMAVVLVGAMIVAGIETVWAGQVAPGKGEINATDYRQLAPAIHLAKGMELGRFKLGSTAIVIYGPNIMRWNDGVENGQPVRMGEALGTLL